MCNSSNFCANQSTCFTKLKCFPPVWLIPNPLGLQILDRALDPRSELLRHKQNRHPPGPNAYILLRRRVALETRRRLHGRSAEKMRIFTLPASCEGGIVYVDHVIEWKKRAGACLTVYARFPNQRLGVAQWEPKARRNGHEKPWMISSSLRTTNDIWNIVEEVLYFSHWEML